LDKTPSQGANKKIFIKIHIFFDIKIFFPKK
jgi:hypothetical protein